MARNLQAHAPPGRIVKEAPTPGNSLRLDEAGLERFLSRREAGEHAVGDEALKRRYVRWPYRVVTVRVEFAHPGGSETKVVLACRNLSAGGIALLHRHYVHPGTRCAVWLLDVWGHEVLALGTVVRSDHVDGSVHEVGVRFDASLDARQFVKLNPFEGSFALEKVAPASLKGTIVYVEDSVLDQALMRHYLRETQISLQVVSTLEDAVAKAIHADLILSDFDLDGFTAVELATRLKEEGIAVPIIILTADTSQAMLERMSRAPADAFMAKPLKACTLYRGIAEFMRVNDGGVMTSTLPAEHPNLALMPTFVQQVRDYAGALDKAIGAKSVARCRALCLQIAGAAPVMGLEKLAGLARAAETALAANASDLESAGALKVLINACMQVSARNPG
jgi:CheY-like chemotaxis protein